MGCRPYRCGARHQRAHGPALPASCRIVLSVACAGALPEGCQSRGTTMTPIEHRIAAWDWLLRLREEAVTQDDLTQWLRWYEADERHKQAFDEAQAFWHSSAQALEGPGALTIADLLN